MVQLASSRVNEGVSSAAARRAQRRPCPWLPVMPAFFSILSRLLSFPRFFVWNGPPKTRTVAGRPPLVELLHGCLPVVIHIFIRVFPLSFAPFRRFFCLLESFFSHLFVLSTQHCQQTVWTMSGGRYYDLDAILSEQETVPCTFHIDVIKIGHLDPHSPDSALRSGATVDLPLWLAKQVGAREGRRK